MTSPESFPPTRLVAIHKVDLPSPAFPIMVSPIDQGPAAALVPGGFRFLVAGLPEERSYSPRSVHRRLEKRTIECGPGCYLVVKDSIAEPTTDGLQAFLSTARQTVALFELNHPGGLLHRVYEGAVCTDGNFSFLPEHPITVVARSVPSATDLANAISDGSARLLSVRPEERDRFRLAARWFSKGTYSDDPIDRFLSYWIALEIHPTAGTTRVPEMTAQYIGTMLGISPATIKAQLWLGQLTGIRGKIVHHGRDAVRGEEYSAFVGYLHRLKAVVTFVLKGLLGIRDDEALRQYLDSTEQPPRFWPKG